MKICGSLVLEIDYLNPTQTHQMESSYELKESEDQSGHLLDDIDYTYTQASPNQRFGNYLIDRAAFYGLWRIFMTLFARPVVSILRTTSRDRNVLKMELLGVGCMMFVIYFTAFEALSKGKTLGKWFTGTRVVTADGHQITPKLALLRSLCRLIPFEFVSAIGKRCYPWHDKFTNTLVIVESASNLPPEPH
jgi:uncharacterized RDD family membrane protein YckC